MSKWTMIEQRRVRKMPLPTNITEQIKGFKGEKKAGEVVEFINTTYPQLKINKFHVYKAWKGLPRKKVEKGDKPAKVKGKGKRGKKAAAAAGLVAKKPEDMTLDELFMEIRSLTDQMAGFFRGTLMAIRGDLLKKTAELRKSQVVEDPPELKLGDRGWA